MKTSDFDLKRLLEAAASAPRRPIPEVPFGLELRAIQAWRNGIQGVDEEVVWIGLFRRVFLFSCVVMVVSVLLSYPSVPMEPNYELVIANSVMQMSFAP